MRGTDGGAVVGGAVDVRVAAREGAVAGWDADRRDGVRRGEPGAFTRELIEMGRLDDLVARATHHVPLHLVHHDEEDVGLSRRGSVKTGERCQQQGDECDDLFHGRDSNPQNWGLCNAA